MRQQAPKFWMVYGDGQRGSTVKHRTKKQAGEEASRLARLNPGTPFFILSVVGASSLKNPNRNRSKSCFASLTKTTTFLSEVKA